MGERGGNSESLVWLSEPGPKNGEQYGAPIKEEDWEDDNVVDFNVKSVQPEAPKAVLNP
ncbi:NAC transcription factor-like protein [Trifolium pratense]|uniref:NAC transcription factor-like protein n=1 Tax=Trifolium pratense TaxID=57577 RepID=A0A2K3M1E5_TRIPR|nr:NAC transcription factor-like protein [Trifolium pratense]